ncbi:MAG: DEAD/DEAH box helicase [Verrucomicrobiales bacterium]|nr:DEAD/DEAH box helicase [Verrucomicrobiales bacterium]
MPGILEDLSLREAPIYGRIFSPEQIQRGLRYYREGRVRVVTSNINGTFAGIFGEVLDLADGPTAEVSVVVRRTGEGDWSIDGRASTERQSNTDRVVALLLAAKAESGSPEAIDRLTFPATIYCFRADVRVGILHWDDYDARNLLEHLPMARISPGTDADGRVETWLRACGLRRLVEMYPWDEIDPGCRECYAFPAKTLAEQELRWADFIANHPPADEGIDARLDFSADFGLSVMQPADWYGEIAEVASEDGVDWFGFECGIRLGRERINMLPCLVEYLRCQPENFRLSDLKKLDPKTRIPIRIEDSDRYVAIPVSKLSAVLAILAELFDEDPLDPKGKLKLHSLRAAQLVMESAHAGNGGNRLVDQAPDYLLKTAEDLEHLRPKDDSEVPQGFLASLRPYQEDGFRWLQFLREQKFGGILADDMGLGKTVQTLCHLFEEKKSGRGNLPCLIIAPKSVVPNWEKEAKKFAPSLTVLALQGDKRKRYYPVLKYSDLVVTSYPVLLRDADELLAQEFHYVVLDEAHTIKNAGSQVTQVAWKIKARHRLALSGTPIENHLGELWSLFHFLMPGFLGSEESFRRCYRIPIEKDRDESRRERLAKRVAPLMLRRTKDLVAKDLPPKTEIVRTIELTPKQVELYEAVRASLSRDLKEEIKRRGLEASKILILDALLKLRQVCCHPRLLSLPSAQKVKSSAKLDLLMELIPDMVEEGRRILIFSQFAQMLGLIEQALDKEKIPYITLTGATKDRGALCDDFQAGKYPVFLISLRAGGTGLNLTAADTVIHYDPWWNPALESQATDRAYRIGQKNPVFVYKLISQGTIEEKILYLQQKKRALFQGILEGSPQKLEFSEADLRDLLAPIAE